MSSSKHSGIFFFRGLKQFSTCVYVSQKAETTKEPMAWLLKMLQQKLKHVAGLANFSRKFLKQPRSSTCWPLRIWPKKKKKSLSSYEIKTQKILHSRIYRGNKTEQAIFEEIWWKTMAKWSYFLKTTINAPYHKDRNSTRSVCKSLTYQSLW